MKQKSIRLCRPSMTILEEENYKNLRKTTRRQLSIETRKLKETESDEEYKKELLKEMKRVQKNHMALKTKPESVKHHILFESDDEEIKKEEGKDEEVKKELDPLIESFYSEVSVFSF